MVQSPELSNARVAGRAAIWRFRRSGGTISEGEMTLSTGMRREYAVRRRRQAKQRNETTKCCHALSVNARCYPELFNGEGRSISGYLTDAIDDAGDPTAME